MSLNEHHKEFFDKLRALLGEYNCEIEAADDGRPYGMHLPFVRFCFTDPYGEYETTFVCFDE